MLGGLPLTAGMLHSASNFHLSADFTRFQCTWHVTVALHRQHPQIASLLYFPLFVCWPPVLLSSQVGLAKANLSTAPGSGHCCGKAGAEAHARVPWTWPGFSHSCMGSPGGGPALGELTCCAEAHCGGGGWEEISDKPFSLCCILCILHRTSHRAVSWP